MVILSVLLVGAAKLFNHFPFLSSLPEISTSTVETLLSILSQTMMAVSTFAVGSMVAAYFCWQPDGDAA